MTKMLVVDDDAAWRALYRMAFEGQFEIVEAADGHQGLSVLDSANPDVILLDLRMPRMDGLDFIRRLNSKGDHPPIVVCSGTISDGERPSIPASMSGIRLTAKTPDLRDVWAALRSAVPQVTEGPPGTTATAMDTEGTSWRD